MDTRATVPASILVVLTAFVLCPAEVAWSAQYTVDRNHARAADTNAGTADAPLKTIARGAALARPGDTVLVKAGTYREVVTLKTSGTGAARITLKAAPGERVIVDGSGTRPDYVLSWGEGVGYLTIDGFEVTGDGRYCIGSSAAGGHDIMITRCIAYNDAYAGVGLYGQSNITIRHCVAARSKYGIIINKSKNILVEENEVFGNRADALSVSHESHNIRLVRNYFHNEWDDDHPDGFQSYFTVTNLLVDSNLIMNTGQGLSVGEADGVTFVNNIIAGQHHTGVSLTHGSSDNCRVLNNTVAYTGFRGLYFTGKGTVIRNNVILTGGDGKAVLRATREPWESDYNLVWKPDGARHDQPEGGAKHTKFADPMFRHAPPLRERAVFYVDMWADKQAPAKCTPDTLCLGRKGMPEHFAVGDHVEVNFDGVVRKVTRVSDDSVSFQPPLKKLHPQGWDVIVNWKAETDFAWDLRLADDSPGKGMGDEGQDVGSNIDMQAYMRGDFDGDGKRDLPSLPPELAAKREGM